MPSINQTVHYRTFKLHKETFPPESDSQTCEKVTVGIHLSSEMAKTGLNVTASSNIRQITDVCE